MSETKIVTDIKEFCALRDAGSIVEIDEEMYYYFLEVLPPAWMNKTVTMPDGRTQYTSFGFAEGWEKVTAFWSTKTNGQRHYFAQQTNILNPNRW